MTDSSRTSKSIRNSKVALIYTFFNSILSFFSRKIFLDHLGTEILGLNTTAVNILQFLNLAELGIGTAVTFTIYKPLFEKDYESVNEIVSVQGWLYRRIAWWMIGGALVAMCLFPFIFNKMELPLWYAYASFGVLLVSSLLGYFVNYKQIILTADQCEYAITYSYKGTLIVKTFCQMAAVYYFPNGYLWWLILEFVFAFVASWRLNQTIRKRAPFLHSSVSLGRKIKGKYPDIIIKIKQLFFHKISGFILTEVTPLIIYGYANLSLVALYGNYLVIISGVKLAVSSVFDSIGASVGNLVAEGDSPKIMTVFNELFSSRFLFITTACFCLYILTPEFVTLWIGPQYVLSNSTLLLMILTLYIRCRKTTVDVYLNAYGLFNDIWAPITEACLNIGLSILFGYFWGLNGILAGVLASLFIVHSCWKPYFLFSKGLHVPIITYIQIYARHILAAAIATGLTLWIFSFIHFPRNGHFSGFLLRAAITSSIYFLLLSIGLFCFTVGMRDFVARIRRIIS